MQKKHRKTVSRFQIAYWTERKGYSEEDAKKKVSEIQRSNSAIASKRRKEEPFYVPTQLEYYIQQGYNEQEAILLRSERQKTFGLQQCITKHGKVEGERIFQERQLKWQHTLASKPVEEIKAINKRKDSSTIEWALRKSNNNIELAKILYRERGKGKDSASFEWAMKSANGDIEKAKNIYELRNKSSKKGRYYHRPFVSKESLRVLKPLYKKLRKETSLGRNDIFWGILGSREYKIINEDHTSVYSYDFTILPLKIIIEYNNVMFHPRQETCNWSHPYDIQLTREEAILKDNVKKETAIKNGFTVLEIWNDENTECKLREIFEYVKSLL